MEERNSWEQQEDEPTLWYGRFRKFLLMGTKRSINAVFKKESNKKQQEATMFGYPANCVESDEPELCHLSIPRALPDSPMFPGPHWYDAAKQWKWEERARAYDQHERAEEDRAIAEEKDKVLRSGFALMHKRTKELDRLSRQLIQMTRDEGKIWIPETRTVVMGEDRSQTVEKIAFNHQLFVLIDKYFDSIAKEVGDRVKKQELDVKANDESEMKALHDKVMAVLEKYPEAKWEIAAVMNELDKAT